MAAKVHSQETPADRFRIGGLGFARRTTGWDPGLTSTPAQAAVSRRKDRLEAVFASPSMGFVKRMCQAEEASLTTGRKSTDPAFRYRSVACFGLIDRGVLDRRAQMGGPGGIGAHARANGLDLEK